MKRCGLTEINEEAVLEFLTQKFTAGVPTGVYSIFSMLKATLPDHHLDQYFQVKEFMKKISKGYKPKKGSRFTNEHLHAFVSTADQTTHLLNMVIIILGVTGAMCRKEIYDLEEENVADKGEYIEVSLRDTRTQKNRKFLIINQKVRFADIIRSYMALRPEGWEEKRFLFAYSKGKVSMLPVGINRVGEVPGTVAKFLNLPDPERYTAHAFKRSGTAHSSE